MNELKSIQRWRSSWKHGTMPAADRAECPSADQLAMLACAPDQAHPSVLEHVERCSACSAELRAVSACEGLDELVNALTVSQAPRLRPISWAAAAAVVLAAALVILQQIPTPPQQLTRSGLSALVIPASNAVLAAPPRRLEWPAESDTRQRVVLFDAAATRIWESDPVAGSAVDLPEAVRDRLSPGTYLWQLRVIETGATRGPFAFEIKDEEGQE